MNYEIKRLNSDDIEQAEKAVILFLDKDEVVSKQETLFNLLSNEAFYFVIAGYDEQIVGRLIAYEFDMVKNNTREVYLYEIDVLENHQNKGVGASLINYTKQICSTRGVSYMFVGTEKENEQAQKLYAKTGAKLQGHLPHYEYRFNIK